MEIYYGQVNASQAENCLPNIDPATQQIKSVWPKTDCSTRGDNSTCGFTCLQDDGQRSGKISRIQIRYFDQESQYTNMKLVKDLIYEMHCIVTPEHSV